MGTDVDASGDRPWPSARIFIVSGPPGVGKTSLVVRWAYRAKGYFRDGILYFDMGGFGPGTELTASQALDACLRTLAVPGDRIPLDTGSRSALYRSTIAHKRLLVVIDNVINEEQAEPLIPGSTDSYVVITSRRRLSGLTVRLGAIPISLGVLSAKHSLDLLGLTLSPERVGFDMEAAAKLVERCSYLPLALRILGQRIAEDPYCTVKRALNDLNSADSSLDRIRFEGDELSDIRAVFSYSYNALEPSVAQTLRLLGIYPVPEFSSSAAAALAGTDSNTIRRQLDRLVDASLISVVGPDRYKMHDLLRTYAGERAEAQDSVADRAFAVRRLASWALRAIRSVQKIVLPSFNAVEDHIGPETEPPAYDSADSAISWFEQERLALLAIVKSAVAYEQLDVAWRISATVYPILEIRHYWSDWTEISRIGIKSARQARDSLGQARNYLSLGDALWLSGHYDEAIESYEAGLEHSRRAGDPWSEAFCLRQIGMVFDVTDRVERATEAFSTAIPLFRSLQDRRGEAMSLIGLGASRWSAADYPSAAFYCQSALDLLATTSDSWSIAWAKCALARAQVNLDQVSGAVSNYREARETFAKFGNSRNEARAMVGLGEAFLRMNRRDEAFGWFERAGTLLEPLKDVASAEVKKRLRAAAGEEN